ncbi:MAG: hypothetical protein AB7E72_08125 [Lysobacterales bacterium]
MFKAEERGTGEDWAEKISCELAARLGLPHVHYDLAEESIDGTPGVVCASIATGDRQLVLGNQLLLDRDTNYPMEDVRHYKVRAHTVDAVANVLNGLEPPTSEWTSNLPDGIVTALDCYLGYVMLDALVANQDRHHENWGALRVETVLRLAPSFDHGASLARNLSDAERKSRLDSTDRGFQVPTFAQRARSAFYENDTATRAMGTLAAWQAFAQRSLVAATAWKQRLASIDAATINTLLQEIPPNRLSVIGQRFTAALLLENQRRIVAGEPT